MRFSLALSMTCGLLLGCGSKAAPELEATKASAEPVASASASAAAAPSPAPSSSEASEPAFPKREKRTQTGWLVIEYGGSAVALATLPPDGKTKLEMLGADAETEKTLSEVWDEITEPEAIGLDFHLPSPDGGRGDNATMLVSPEHTDWVYAATEELERKDFSVDEVQPLDEANLPATIAKLEIARRGEPVGTLDFDTSPPKLTLTTTDVDGDFLEGHWEGIQKQPELTVRYHTADGSDRKLVTLTAAPGDAGYANAVRVYLMMQHEYVEKRGYELTIVP